MTPTAYDRRQWLGLMSAGSAIGLLGSLPPAALAQTAWKPTQTITYGIGVAPGYGDI